MATYNFPSIKPSRQSFELVTNTKTFTSPLSKAVQTLSRKGSHWKTTMTFSNLDGADRAALQAFIAKLDGQTHRMRISDYGYVRRGAASSGSPVVKGAGQSGSTLLADGASLSTTSYLAAGDYISFNDELHMVTADVNSDSSGNLSIPIAPPIRKSPPDNSSIEYLAPYGVFMMINNPSWSTQPPYISNITIEAIEDVLA
jgi:hypothetical protein